MGWEGRDLVVKLLKLKKIFFRCKENDLKSNVSDLKTNISDWKPNLSNVGGVCGLFYDAYNSYGDITLTEDEKYTFNDFAEQFLESHNKSLDEYERLLTKLSSLNDSQFVDPVKQIEEQFKEQTAIMDQFLNAGKEYEGESLIMREFGLQVS